MDFRQLLEQQRRNKEQKQKEYEEDSKNRLLKIGSKQIRTTMIGALDIIEKNFGFLWNHNGYPETPEQKEFKEKYEEIRKAILDKGNQQIHNFTQEIQQYQIVWKRYNITIPVVSSEAQLQQVIKDFNQNRS